MIFLLDLASLYFLLRSRNILFLAIFLLESTKSSPYSELLLQQVDSRFERFVMKSATKKTK